MKAALTACSDPMLLYQREDIERLKMLMEKEGLTVTVSPYLFEPFRGLSGKDKADDLMRFFSDPDMDLIFDVSGGDIANSVLEWLDYDVIGKSRALFCGYSDLTTVLNAVYTCAGRETLNYQIRNLLYDNAGAAAEYFRERILHKSVCADDLACRFLRGNAMHGRVLGGNIRCFLKLAGTPFFPDLRGAVFLLEACSGSVMKMTAYLHQLRQLGAFDKINGILLGTFTEMEQKGTAPAMPQLVREIAPPDLPIAETRYIGHGTDARAVVIGREYFLEEG